jgi:hypothetical protein
VRRDPARQRPTTCRPDLPLSRRSAIMPLSRRSAIMPFASDVLRTARLRDLASRRGATDDATGPVTH